MDHDDLWKVTIVPSISFKTTSLSSRATFSTRTLSITSEQESKQNLCLSFENEKESEDTCKVTERSKIMLPSHDHPKFNCDDSSGRFHHSERKSEEKSISSVCKNRKELNDQMNKKISTRNTCIEICEDTNNLLSVDVPFIELGAVYKILEFISDSNPNVSSLTNSCRNEISRILRSLLMQCCDKTLEELLSNDSSLYRCEHCGVISYILPSHSAAEKIKENKMKIRRNEDNQSNEESKILINTADIKINAQSKVFVNDCKIDRRVKCKHESNGTESVPIKERAFVMKSHTESLNRANDIFDAEADANANVKNKSHFNNNTVKREWLPDVKTSKEQMRYECNDATKNDHRNDDEPLIPIKAYADIDKEEIVRKIVYESKSQIDDLLAEIWYSKNAQQKIQQHSQQSFEKHDDIYMVTDTVKYLARGPFAMSGKEEDELFSKLQDRRRARLVNAGKGQSSVLYGSRNDYPQRSSGFWLFDKSGRLPEALDEYHYLPMSKLNNQQNTRFTANILQHSNTTEKIRKTGSWFDCLEKDSLEDCARLQQREESDTATFSSSSAENLIYEWMGSVDTRNEINDINDDVPRGRRLVSSRPSLDIARHVKAEIAKDTCFDNAKKSMLQARDSNIVAQLSLETRRKICHLIQKIILSDSAKDSTFSEKCLMTDALNGEKLLHSKSVDARFVHSSNQNTNICANDYIPIKLSDSSEDKNYLFRKPVDSVSICSQDLNKFKDAIQIPHKNMITPISPDESTQRKNGHADNSTKGIIARRIIYKDTSLRNIVNKDDGYTDNEILSIYREILENSEYMEWDSFKELVENLHPEQKEMWHTICRTISEEAKRERTGDADGDMEVCIEINPVNPEETEKTSEITTCTREIVFEIDMALKNVKNFLDKWLHPTDEYFDKHKSVHKDATSFNKHEQEPNFN